MSLDGSLPTDDQVVAAKQVQFTKTVPNGRLVEVQSPHDIDLDEPELVIQEIQRVLEA